ncbi:dihydroorotate dehydrogenase [Tilletia horrida]|uniref:Dihydroorotate oxidase n=1 Tax=Tilletia horrida TaxID=155126 RepID=A0AAN6GVS4_9BASI|nr:dihydroorotate dehydrogenase [Tilletia horrida]KAK0556450.1 dihydroorotate dehydrogenase [Tilletia horrida]
MAGDQIQIGSLIFDVPKGRLPLLNTGLTTRTAVVKAEAVLDSVFEENPDVHTVSFMGDHTSGNQIKWSLNSYGYSPHTLQFYLDAVEELLADKATTHKPVIISITGTPEGVEGGIERIHKWATDKVERPAERIGIEINLSCPNIAGATIPSGYDAVSISAYVRRIQVAVERSVEANRTALTIGLKLPPYTYEAQFTALVEALEARVNSRGQCGIHFLTATNTLGSSLWLSEQNGILSPSLPVLKGFTGFGGLAGAALHPLALGEPPNRQGWRLSPLITNKKLTIEILNVWQGNVRRHRTLLDASTHTSIRALRIIGAGGVDSQLAAQRMVAAGADIVGLATALGQRGPDIFAEIAAQTKE